MQWPYETLDLSLEKLIWEFYYFLPQVETRYLSKSERLDELEELGMSSFYVDVAHVSISVILFIAEVLSRLFEIVQVYNAIITWK